MCMSIRQGPVKRDSLNFHAFSTLPKAKELICPSVSCSDQRLGLATLKARSSCSWSSGSLPWSHRAWSGPIGSRVVPAVLIHFVISIPVSLTVGKVFHSFVWGKLRRVQVSACSEARQSHIPFQAHDHKRFRVLIIDRQLTSRELERRFLDSAAHHA